MEKIFKKIKTNLTSNSPKLAGKRWQNLEILDKNLREFLKWCKIFVRKFLRKNFENRYIETKDIAQKVEHFFLFLKNLRKLHFSDSKKGSNCPKGCQKCEKLAKWPLGTKRKRQNVFSRSPSKKFKVIFLTFFQISKKVNVKTLTFVWLDLTFP